MATSYYARLANKAQEYAIQNGDDLINIDKTADWLIETDQYKRLPISAKQQCKQDLRKALQQANHIDPQGRKIRTNHAVKIPHEGEQLTLWLDVRIAKPDKMQMAFKQSHDAIANDVKRHSIEKQSYDDNNPYSVTLSAFDYDFNADADAARLSGEYDDSFDEDDFDDDLD